MKTVSSHASALNRICLGLAGALLSMAALGAGSSDWWIDIANDRAQAVGAKLAQGMDPNQLSPKGQPAIMQAIRDGAWNVYAVLAANPKTSLNAINANRETPLMYLAVLGETKRAQDLIKRGAMVNRLGWTPLQYAASTGKAETARMLIANKAIINAPAPDGTTALMMAAHSGNHEVVQLLLDHGADVTVHNLQKLDAADWARDNKHNDLAAELDALSGKIQRQRAGLRQQHQAREASGGLPDAAGGGAANNSGLKNSSDVKNLDPKEIDTGAAAKPDTVPAPAKPAGKSTSNSPYFDLERFNEPATP